MNNVRIHRRHAVAVAAGALVAVAVLFGIWDAVDHGRRDPVPARVVRHIQSGQAEKTAVLEYDAGGFEGLIDAADSLFGGEPLAIGTPVDLFVDTSNPASTLSRGTRREIWMLMLGLLGLALVFVVIERLSGRYLAWLERGAGSRSALFTGLQRAESIRIMTTRTAIAVAAVGVIGAAGVAAVGAVTSLTRGMEVMATPSPRVVHEGPDGFEAVATPLSFEVGNETIVTFLEGIEAAPGVPLALRYEPGQPPEIWEAGASSLVSPFLILLVAVLVFGALTLSLVLPSPAVLEVRRQRVAGTTGAEDTPPARPAAAPMNTTIPTDAHLPPRVPPRSAEGLDGGADNPAEVPLSDARARALFPSAFGFVRLVFKVIPGLKPADLEDLAKRLWSGDSNPAVVVSVTPLRVAAYTWDLDAVVILAFTDDHAEGLELVVGQRLLSANYYHAYDDGVLADDIDAGPAATGGWHNVHPTIADFLSDYHGHIEAQKLRIPEEAWQRTEALGRAKFAARPHMARIGDPFFSYAPAGDQRDADG